MSLDEVSECNFGTVGTMGSRLAKNRVRGLLSLVTYSLGYRVVHGVYFAARVADGSILRSFWEKGSSLKNIGRLGKYMDGGIQVCLK